MRRPVNVMAVIMAQAAARCARLQSSPWSCTWTKLRTFVHVSAIIAAGGRGARLGAGLPKQLLELGGVPILQRSVEAFLGTTVWSISSWRCRRRSGGSARLSLVGGQAGHAGRRRGQATGLGGAGVRPRVVGGGCRGGARRGAAARDADLIDAHAGGGCARRRAGRGAVTDTVKRAARDGMVRRDRPRDRCILAQTPQAFATDVLRIALSSGGTPRTRPRSSSAPGFPCGLWKAIPGT